MKIRRGSPADLPRAVEIWRSAVDATHLFLSPEDRVAIDVLVSEELLPAAELWLASNDDGRAMGFMVTDGPSIDALFVDPAVHRHGFGTLLIEHALSREPHVTVDANEQAPDAVRFYLNRGFRIVGRSPCDRQGRAYPLVHLAR
jgi:putative acetyltransferase